MSALSESLRQDANKWSEELYPKLTRDELRKVNDAIGPELAQRIGAAMARTMWANYVEPLLDEIEATPAPAIDDGEPLRYDAA